MECWRCSSGSGNDAPSVLASPLGVYREMAPPPSLRNHFTCVWVHAVPETMAKCLHVVPDGHVDLQWVGGRLRVAGPDSVVNRESLPPGVRVVGFRFRPGAALWWLDVSPRHLLNTRIPLEAFCGSAATELASETADHRLGFDGVISNLTSALVHRAKRVRGAAPIAGAIFESLANDTGASETVARSLAASLGVSPRTLRRHAQESFGYGVKTLHRILRFQAFLSLARSGPPRRSLAELAALAGYADQPHLSRESMRLAGMTPAQVFQAIGAR
jgi:AraC-like DNA-binding protein